MENDPALHCCSQRVGASVGGGDVGRIAGCTHDGVACVGCIRTSRRGGTANLWAVCKAEAAYLLLVPEPLFSGPG